MTEAAMHGFFDLSLTMYHLSPKADVFTHTHTHTVLKICIPLRQLL